MVGAHPFPARSRSAPTPPTFRFVTYSVQTHSSLLLPILLHGKPTSVATLVRNPMTSYTTLTHAETGNMTPEELSSLCVVLPTLGVSLFYVLESWLSCALNCPLWFIMWWSNSRSLELRGGRLCSAGYPITSWALKKFASHPINVVTMTNSTGQVWSFVLPHFPSIHLQLRVII